MKKTVKGIIGLGAVLVVLGGGLAALKLTEPADKPAEDSSDESSAAEGAGIVLVKDKDGGNGVISGVTVVNESGSLDVIMKTASTDDSAATYTLEGYEDIPLITSMVGTLAYNAEGLESTALIAENCTDTDKYGFDSPQAEVEITYESGASVKFTVGDIAPTASDTYVMLDGSNDVYTVSTSTVSNYTNKLFDFVSKTILEEPDEDDYPIVDSLRIQRADMESDILLEYDKKSDDVSYTGGTSATHVMMEPTFSYLALEKSTPITNGMFGLTAQSIYSIHAGEAEIAEAGLSDPFCKVTMSCGNGSDYVLLMSEPFDDENSKKMHYAMLEGGNVIYTVSAENAQWATIQPEDIASKILFGTFVWNISDMKITGEDIEPIEFKVTQKDGTENKENLKAEDFDVEKNGENYDSERYRQFYSFLVKASAEEFALDAEIPKGSPMAAIEFTDSYVNITQKVEFYDYSTLTALIVINGKSKYTCSKSYVETLIENANRIETGEEYITTWK